MVDLLSTIDIENHLAQPLVARVAANGPNGPTVRPVWFLYEKEGLLHDPSSGKSPEADLLRGGPDLTDER